MEFESLGASLMVGKSRLFHTNSGIFIRDGDAYLIDPCIFPDEIDAVRDVALQQPRVHGIIVTHSHWDHILGPERIPGTPVIAHNLVGAHFNAERTEIVRLVDERLAANGARRERPFVPPVGDVAVGDVLTLPFGNGSLRMLHAPGHCSDQIVIYETRERVLWAADMLSDIEIPFVEDVVAYRQTLERVMQLAIEVLVPGHGAFTSSRDEIQERLASDHRYLVDLERAVAMQVDRGRSLEQINDELGSWSVRNPEVNSREHARNVETVYQDFIQRRR